MSVSSVDEMNKFWATPCKELIKQQNLIVIDSKDTLINGFRALVKNKISSAPVYDKQANEYVGMFDYRDVLEYLLLVFHEKEFSAESEEEEFVLSEIVKKASEGHELTMKYAADLSRKNPFISVDENDSIESVVKHMMVPKHVHRVNVTDKEKRVVGIISQTDILNFVSRHINLFAHIVCKTIAEAGICHSPAVSVDASAKVMDALFKMNRYGISSVAIVDENGNLFGNISLTDIKAEYSRLWATCGQLVSHVLMEQGLENDGKDRFPILDVHLESSINQAIRKLFATHVHRVWVVDKDEVLTGVVSLYDIIHFFYKECCK